MTPAVTKLGWAVAVALALAAPPGAAADPAPDCPSVDQLVSAFDNVVFGSEIVGVAPRRTVWKWRQPLRVLIREFDERIDRNADAYNGSATFAKDGPDKDLRAVFSLHAEPFTVVARADSGIKTFTDLQGKRLNVSNPGSGARGTMITVMRALGWGASAFSEVHQLEASAQAEALCDDKVDVIVFTVGHPSETINRATSLCNTRLVNVEYPKIDAMIQSHRTIPRPAFWPASTRTTPGASGPSASARRW
ncbi:MAG: TAXI family TRAP transporter solute-binding subunit [Rhodospirillaceae bacterium]